MVSARREIGGGNRADVSSSQRHRLARWRGAIEGVLAAGGPEIVFQPIIDIQRGQVTGYEALARFAPWGQARPHEWFARAGQLRLNAPLEAAVAAKALAAAPTLPAGRFLAVNLSADTLLSDPLNRVFEAQPSLKGFVIELTEHRSTADPKAFAAVLAQARAAGALVSVDDSGTGYAGLHWIQSIRPDMVKLDRSFVSGIHGDAAKLALTEMLGSFTSRIDAWLLAEGVEEVADLDALVGLGVPLAQGHLLAREAPGWGELGPEMATHLAHRPRRDVALPVGSLVHPSLVVPAARREPTAGASAPQILVDEHGVPVGYSMQGAAAVLPATGMLRVLATELSAVVLERAMDRPPAARWHPLACVDDAGLVLGIIWVDELARTVAHHAARSDPAKPDHPTSTEVAPAQRGSNP